MWMSKSKNKLGKVDLAAIDPPKERRKKRRSVPSGGPGGKTRMAREVRTRQREAMPPDIGIGLKELEGVDDDDPRLKIKPGRPRKYQDDDEELDWEDKIRRANQKRYRERRARVRKYEAEVVEATRVMSEHANGSQNRNMEVFDEELAIAQGLLNFDDWDNEELIRGYRRGRTGKFGKPPRFIPREVQQQAFRVLASRGTSKLQGALLESIEQLLDLVRNADSEKVRLEAIKELMNRVVGKTPDIVLSGSAKPWEEALVDSLVPVSSALPLELEPGDDGVARMAPIVIDERDGEVEESLRTGLAASPSPEDPDAEAPSPSRSAPRRQKSGVKKSKSKKSRPKEAE